jgi:hypothetical protein
MNLRAHFHTRVPRGIEAPTDPASAVRILTHLPPFRSDISGSVRKPNKRFLPLSSVLSNTSPDRLPAVTTTKERVKNAFLSVKSEKQIAVIRLSDG